MSGDTTARIRITHLLALLIISLGMNQSLLWLVFLAIGYYVHHVQQFYFYYISMMRENV